MNFSNLNSVTKGLRYGKRLRPARDWLVLLAIFMAALAISVAYNLWLFSQVTRGQKVGDAPVTASTQIPLDQVKGLFDARASERERYASEYRFVDPSL